MLVSKVTTGLFKNAQWKAEILYLGIIRFPQNSPETKQILLIQKRSKSDSDEKKKYWEEKPKKPKKLRTLATIALVGTTAAVIAAKYDDDFRDWSKENVPALDSLVKIVFQEEDTYLQTVDKAHKTLSSWVKNAIYTVVQLFKEKSQSRPSGHVPSAHDRMGPLPPIEPCDEGKKTYFQGKQMRGPLPPVYKELSDLEDQLGQTAQATIQNAATTACALRDQAKLIDYLDQIINSDNHKVWERLRKARDDAVNGLEKHQKNAVNLGVLIEQLQAKLQKGELSEPEKAKGYNNISTIKKDVDDAVAKMEKAKEDAILARRSWDKVKQARLHFSEELETLFPNIWLNDEQLNIPVDQLDPFTEKVLNEIEGLSRQGARTQTITLAHLNSALERYKNKDPDAMEELTGIVAPYEISKEKKKLEAEMQKNILAHKAKCDKNAKATMKQTNEVYADLTNEALRIKEKDVERKMQQKLDEQLAMVRAQHKLEVAKMVGRMQGANEAIAKRGEKDKSQQDKQQFWSAAQSFMAAVKPIGAAAQGQGPKPLKNEVTNLTKVKPEKDDLVDTVLGTIPQEAIDKGVPSEACLRERFMKVMKSARGWAGVPPGEITLVQLLLAKVQSALYLNVAIPQAELDNEPAIDPEKLNNYDILFRAKYYVDRGEFDQAIRYLNLLKGPSGKIAKDWVKDAMVYLETRQAAEVLLAHATAAGMQD